MTINKSEFIVLCGYFGILPGIAIENSEVVKAIKAGSTYDELSSIFSEVF